MPGVTFNIYNSDLNQIIIEKYNIEYAIRKMAELGFQTQNLQQAIRLQTGIINERATMFRLIR